MGFEVLNWKLIEILSGIAFKSTFSICVLFIWYSDNFRNCCIQGWIQIEETFDPLMLITSYLSARLWNSVSFIQGHLKASAQRCVNLLNILVSGFNSGSKNSSTQLFLCIKKILVPVFIKFILETVSFWVRVKWTICELLTQLLRLLCKHLWLVCSIFFLWISTLMNIFVICLKMVDITLKRKFSS